MKFRFIAAQKAKLSVKRACALLDVSPSGYYAALERPVSRRKREDMTLLAHIRAAFTRSNETYGSPRMVHELREAGFDVGRRRVARLMREDGLQARIKRRFKRTTDSAHSHSVAHNHLAQEFSPSRPNTSWAVDMSYIWTKEGWRSSSLEPMAGCSLGRRYGFIFQAHCRMVGGATDENHAAA